VRFILSLPVATLAFAVYNSFNDLVNRNVAQTINSSN